LNSKNYILGAGLSGLICANYFKEYKVLERSDSVKINHRALLRFKSNELSKFINIRSFKAVNVRKSIYHKGKFYDKPDLTASILYSQKVSNTISDRSIWMEDGNHVIRYLPNYNLINELSLNTNVKCSKKIIKIDNGRITFSNGTIEAYDTIISTIPLNEMVKIVGIDDKDNKFKSKSIFTTVIKIKDCDFHHTVYIIDEDTSIYRISFVGNTVIFESMDRITKPIVYDFLTAFGLKQNMNDCVFDCFNFIHQYGKLFSIDRDVVKSILLYLTEEFNIYSLGRYAVWRNIMSEDLIKDILKIKEMIYCDKHKYDIKLGGS